MKVCTHRLQCLLLTCLVGLQLTACAQLDKLKTVSAPSSRPAVSHALVWEIINGGVLEGNIATGIGYVRFLRPEAVAARGPWVYIVDNGLFKLFRYNRDTGSLTVLKDLKTLVPGKVSDIFVNMDLSYYLADWDGARVLYFDPAGKLIHVFKDDINLGRPVSVAQDQATGYVFIADGFNDDVLVYNRAGLLNGAIGVRGNGTGQFRRITAFALGPDGYYVATRFGTSRVQVMNEAGRYEKSFQKDTVIFPTAIAVSSNKRAFVADYLKNDIKVYVDGVYVYSLGRSGSAPGQFARISDLWLDSGFLYVADSLNGRVQVLRVTPENLRKARAPE